MAIIQNVFMVIVGLVKRTKKWLRKAYIDY